ncbi:odorant receptor 131-2-like [Hyperolius riggenbachi]|uniref:odorant receptor 131-2-like n=1 Tax=Hyperolius riggenbachi TaxID=752182 RepID=UPI0035A38099
MAELLTAFFLYEQAVGGQSGTMQTRIEDTIQAYREPERGRASRTNSMCIPTSSAWKKHQLLSIWAEVMTTNELYNNGTLIWISMDPIYQTVVITFMLASIVTYSFFLYFIIKILVIFFTNQHIREKSRYVLFAHMLINDTIYLSLGLLLYIAYGLFHMPVSICYFMLVITVATYRITSYNLAAMALELYLTICFPLHYLMYCTVRKAFLSIAVMWIVGLFPNITDLIVMTSVGKDFFSRSIACRQEELFLLPIQDMIRAVFSLGSLVVVALIILFTYVKVMLVARKTGSTTSSASKAGKTVMLHAVQLLLCMFSLACNVTEAYGGDFVVLANFFVFTCVPRLLSPLIYGLRDEAFNKYIRTIYFKVHRDKSVTK